MKKCNVLLFLLLQSIWLLSQVEWNAGIGLIVDNESSIGVTLDVERNHKLSTSFSLPLKAQLGWSSNEDFRMFSLEVHKGFRRTFLSGIYFEQWLGLGIAGRVYTLDDIWYYDKKGYEIRYKDGLNFDFSPSTSMGLGYEFQMTSGAVSRFWVRPKVFWNFSSRSLNAPFFCLSTWL